MFATKIKLGICALLTACILTGGTGLVGYHTMVAGSAAGEQVVHQPGAKKDESLVLAKEAKKKAELDKLPEPTQSIEGEELLPPTSLRLVYKDTPLNEALADLADKTGCSLVFTERKAAPAAKKITLDTGLTSFWIALDRFCREAGLSCSDTSDGIPQRRDYRRLVRIPPAFNPKPRPGVLGPQGILFLGDAETESPATCYAGALRIRGLRPRPGQLQPESNTLFLLEVKAEPKVPSVQFLGLTIESAVDDQDQKLTRQEPAKGGRALRFRNVNAEIEPPSVVRFTAGNKPSKVIKKLEGTIELLVQKPDEVLLSVDNILEAAGKSVQGLDGESLKVVEVTRADDGSITVRIEMALELFRGYMPGPALGSLQALVSGPGKEPGVQTQFFGLSLVDDKGQGFQIVKTDNSSQKVAGNQFTLNFTLVCKPLKNQGEPAKLIFASSRRVKVKIPIVLKNVPLAVNPNPGEGQS